MPPNVVEVAGALGLLYAARRYYRNWGTTKEECRLALPGDELVGQPCVRSTEAVWIDAPPEAIWPWLVQIGQNRAGLYTFEQVENLLGLHYRNADRIHPEWQRLAPGDAIRLAPEGWLGLHRGLTMRVAQVVDNEAIVLRGAPPEFPWNAVWSFHIQPRWQDRCRVLVRTRARLRHPGQVLITELAGPLTAMLTRGLLLGVRHRVAAWSAAPTAPDRHPATGAAPTA